MTTLATSYSIRVDGHLDDHWSAWLGEIDMARHDDGSTTVTVLVADQAQLHGVLARLRDIGAVLTEVRASRTPHQTCPPMPQRILHTDRLSLRAATDDDAEPTWAYRQLESVNQWLTGCPASQANYRKQFTEPNRLANTVIVTRGHDPAGPIIGDFMIRLEDPRAQLEVADQARGKQAQLGWVLDPAHTGQGYATEAVRELLRYCYQDLGIHRVTASCFLDNEASSRLMERVGMRRELHAVRESLHRSGRWLDTVGYAMTEEEWRSSG